eukprot:PhM_4_TR8788/c0_g1_i1/m.49555
MSTVGNNILKSSTPIAPPSSQPSSAQPAPSASSPSATSTSCDSPCAHNSWDGAFDTKGNLRLHCRLCRAFWMPPRNGPSVCTSYRTHNTCPLSIVCRELHIHFGVNDPARSMSTTMFEQTRLGNAPSKLALYYSGALHRDPSNLSSLSSTPHTSSNRLKSDITTAMDATASSGSKTSATTKKRRVCAVCGFKTKNNAAAFCAGCGTPLPKPMTESNLRDMLSALGIDNNNNNDNNMNGINEQMSSSSVPARIAAPAPCGFAPTPIDARLPDNEREHLRHQVEVNRRRLGALRGLAPSSATSTPPAQTAGKA